MDEKAKAARRKELEAAEVTSTFDTTIHSLVLALVT